ncbi:cysteine/Histidine-rich C1 domain family protein [Striga asiatica]|uniref:Cysteine/Histidine-rich C1 domain family protein n=1 Tax=Striga asiatica TaxID=4170 RepID=A0A5A7P4D3_STRAF|nr:cysteine/Histidine-rich C1 domain family protein [Striga asiatica]
MAGIAILDLLRRNPNFGSQPINSRGLLSVKLVGATSAAAASFAVTTPFAFGGLFGNGVPRVAYCDAGMEALSEDYISHIRTASGNIFQSDALIYSTKQYDIQLKPLLSAFHWKTFALTSLRSFLLFYLPLVEPRGLKEEDDDDDDDFLKPEGKPVDLVVPFKKSVKQILRETSVVTTRRVLERLAVHYVSQRMAWKLLKVDFASKGFNFMHLPCINYTPSTVTDVPQSATRKATRGLPTTTYFFRVSRTTLRGHCLGVLASWIVQVSIDVYRFFSSLTKSPQEDEIIDTADQLEILGKKVYGATVRCGSSLIFASIGAGIGALLIRPSTGQWIGCAVGDLLGPVVVAFCFEKFHLDL